MQKSMEKKKHRDPGKYADRHQWIFAAMVIYLRNKVAGGHIKRHTARNRQRIADGNSQRFAEQHKAQNANQSRNADDVCRKKSLFPGFARREYERGCRETF